ncbi:MAG: hypothetical protein AAF600_13090 [Bacteroidota bacterium]
MLSEEDKRRIYSDLIEDGLLDKDMLQHLLEIELRESREKDLAIKKIEMELLIKGISIDFLS